MIIALVLLIVVLASTAAIGHQLEKAPEGFENHNGFHFIIRDNSPSPTVPGSLVVHDKGTAVASLL